MKVPRQALWDWKKSDPNTNLWIGDYKPQDLEKVKVMFIHTSGRYKIYNKNWNGHGRNGHCWNVPANSIKEIPLKPLNLKSVIVTSSKEEVFP